MHMSSKKDLNSAEMDTISIYSRLWEVLENTPAVLLLGKLCDENGYSHEWINGQKPHLTENGKSEYNVTLRTSFRSSFQACQRVLPQVFPLQHP